MGFFIVSRSGPLEKLRRQEESGTGSGKFFLIAKQDKF